MPAERYFFSGEINLHQPITLADKEFHHLIHVMRSQPGEAIEVVNGQGILAIAELKEIKKTQAILDIVKTEQEKAPAIEVILAQAIPRLNRLDDILEKGTELGVSQIWLFPAEGSERKEINAHQVSRLEAIMIAAMKQCGRLWLPKLMIKKELKLWAQPEGALFFGDVNPSAPTFLKAWSPQQAETIVFFVGPEKGFSEREELLLTKWGASGVKLAPHILRTDTAAIVALALATHMLLTAPEDYV